MRARQWGVDVIHPPAPWASIAQGFIWGVWNLLSVLELF
jgi:hypothetical protein